MENKIDVIVKVIRGSEKIERGKWIFPDDDTLR